MKKSIGIIGGMGPMATVDLFQKIVSLTNAGSDHEHIHIYVDCNPAIPDRTAALLQCGESPVPMIRAGAQKLVAMGADILLLPCNTSHAFFDEITKGLTVPVVNMIEETAKAVQKTGVSRVGLLATDGTVKSGVYEKKLRQHQIDVVIPTPDDQKIVMDMIYKGVKAGNMQPYIQPFCKLIHKMQAVGIQMFILGCTELPLAVSLLEINGIFIDPATVLAKTAIKMAGYSLKKDEEEVCE